MNDPKYKTETKARGDRRNGHSKKTIKGEFGEATLNIPRDRNGEFEPVMVKKGQTRFDGFDGKNLSLYGRGMTTRDIQAQLKDMYGVEVSATLISQVNVIPMFNFPPEIRRVMYTTHAIESMNMCLRKVIRNHRIFANDEAALKVVYLDIENISKKWTMPIREWKPALNRFAIEFEDRFPEGIIL